jgi:hypothetical protein
MGFLRVSPDVGELVIVSNRGDLKRFAIDEPIDMLQRAGISAPKSVQLFGNRFGGGLLCFLRLRAGGLGLLPL